MRTTTLIALAILATACNDKSDGTGDTDTDVGDDSDTVDTTDDTDDSDDTVDTDTDVDPRVERGRYLVDHVAACGDCHTPRLQDGAPDTSKYLAGGFVADIDPGDTDAGEVYAPNLTPHATGLGDWSDDEILTALTTGVDKDDEPLFPMMPYWLFAHMTADDAEAVVAYLKTIPAVDNDVPDTQPGVPSAVQKLPPAVIPETELDDTDEHFDEAEHGKYLVTIAGCIDCHTEDGGIGYPVNQTKILAGGRTFPGALFGLPQDSVYTRNLTPHENGIEGWTAEMVKTALLTGKDEEGEDLCPPMPAGPMGPYGGLTEADALAIGWYLTTIPEVASDDYPECPLPPT